MAVDRSHGAWAVRRHRRLHSAASVVVARLDCVSLTSNRYAARVDRETLEWVERAKERVQELARTELSRSEAPVQAARIVRLADLDADSRRLILALIDGHKNACQITKGCPTCHGVPVRT